MVKEQDVTVMKEMLITHESQEKIDEKEDDKSKGQLNAHANDASVRRTKANEKRVNQQIEVLRDPGIFHHTTQQFGKANQATTT
ncbi:1829_t:CDS:2, partial [Acaulospora morrowiae]